MIPEIETFGARLRAERERRGISLDSIAEQTKIKKSFLENLERGDFSRWPAGEVFRRAYVRDYANAIGIAPEPVVVEFVRLVLVPEPARVPQAEPLTITFDRSASWGDRLAGRTAGAALIDAAGLLACGGALAFLTGASVWSTSGMLAFVYYPATAVLWGRSVGCRLLDAKRLLRRDPTTEAPASAVAVVPTQQPRPSLPLADPAADEPIEIGRLEAVDVDSLLLVGAEGSSSPRVAHESSAF